MTVGRRAASVVLVGAWLWALIVLLGTVSAELGPLIAYGGAFTVRWGVTGVHEAGHLVAARATGARITRLCVSPVDLHVSPWRVGWSRRRFGGGRVEYRPRAKHHRVALVIVAGPLASLSLAIVGAVGVARLADGWAGLAAAVAIVGAGDAIANLIPFAGSDGAALRRIARARSMGRRRPLAGPCPA